MDLLSFNRHIVFALRYFMIVYERYVEYACRVTCSYHLVYGAACALYTQSISGINYLLLLSMLFCVF